MNKQKWSVKKKIALALPLSLLCTGGLATGGVAIAGYVFHTGPFAPTDKEDIENIFEQDGTHWKTDPTDSAQMGYVWNTVQTGVPNYPSNKEIISYLNQYASTTTTPTVTNDLIATVPPNTGSEHWVKVPITTNQYSRGYDGSFNFFIYYDPGATRSLSTDLSNTNLDASTTVNATYLSEVDLLDVLANSNSQLRTNAIKFQYYDTTSAESDKWTDWNWSNKYGIGTVSDDVDQTNSLKGWVKSNDRFEHIRIAPDPNNTTYVGQDPVDITLKLKRTNLDSVTGWQANWTTRNSFATAPDSNNLLSRFDELYSGSSWYIGKLDGVYLSDWNMQVSGSTSIFTISGNPFYTTQNSTTDLKYQFAWEMEQAVDVSTVIINQSGTPINSLTFFQIPSREDVIAFLKHQIKTDVLPSIVWNEINITVNTDPDKIVLVGNQGSLFYTTTAMTISYTIAS